MKKLKMQKFCYKLLSYRWIDYDKCMQKLLNRQKILQAFNPLQGNIIRIQHYHNRNLKLNEKETSTFPSCILVYLRLE